MQKNLQSTATMAKHTKEEVKIFGGKANIYTNEYGVWQFRVWLRNENKYVRKSLRTKVKMYAIEQAEELYIEIRNEQKKGRKYYAITVKEAVDDYLKMQRARIGDGDFNIVVARYKTIETQMRTFLDYVRKDDKITTLSESTLRRYERNGEVTNYVSFRKRKNIGDTTIRNEMTTINSFMKYCFADAKVTHVAAFKYPNMPKKSYSADGEVIRRMTFTSDEYKLFTDAMRSYTAKKNTKHLTKKEIFERQMVRHYFLFAANSGLRSSEIRKLQWHNITTYKDVTSRGSEGIFANILVDRSTTKVRKTRRVYCRGGEHIERWKQLCKENGKETENIVFSMNGKEYDRSNTHRHFRKILSLTSIDEARIKQLVPYSLRHFMITERVKSGLSFSQIAVMCGTSVKQIENTYLHLSEDMMRTSARADYIRLEDGTLRVI